MEVVLLYSNQLKKQRREISSNNSSNYIPEELVVEEILPRLPVKSLSKYKSVCKPWRYLIESRSFIDIYNRHRRDYWGQFVFSPFKSISNPRPSSSLLARRTICSCSSSSSSPTDLIKLTSKPLDVMLPLEMTGLEWPDINCDEPWIGPWRVVVSVLGPTTNGIYCVVANLHRGEDINERRISVTTGKVAFHQRLIGPPSMASTVWLLTL